MYYSSIPELYITLLYVKYRTIISRPSFTAGHGVRISFQYILLLCLWQLPVTIQQWGSRLTGCSGISRSTFSLGCRAYDYCCPAFQLCYRNLCKENAELLKFSSPSLSPQGIAAGWIQRWDEWNQQENTDRGCRLTLPRAPSDLKKKKRHRCLINTSQHSGAHCSFSAPGKCLPLLSRETPLPFFYSSSWCSYKSNYPSTIFNKSI